MQIVSLMPALPKLDVVPPSRKAPRWFRWAVRGLVWGLILAVAAEAARVLFISNVHEVAPGRVYRSAQLSAKQLNGLIQQRGIRTIINLRGYCTQFDWYLDECRLAHDLDVSQEDVTLSANRLPPPTELRRLIEVFDRTEYPIVLHCRQGADRTGLASAIWMLLYSDADYATARAQCGARYAHVPVLTTVSMDRFFDLYEGWLQANSLVHKPANFRQWVLNDYRADPAPAQLELISPTASVEVDKPLTLMLRDRNLSNSTWEFKPGTGTGIHVRYQVMTEGGQPVATHREGRLSARVALVSQLTFRCRCLLFPKRVNTWSLSIWPTSK